MRLEGCGHAEEKTKSPAENCGGQRKKVHPHKKQLTIAKKTREGG